MKVKITFLIAAIVAVFVVESAAECDKVPDSFNLESCCKLAPFGFEEAIAKVSNEMKGQKLDEPMQECKMSEALFKELNWIKDNGIDKDAIIKFSDEHVKDASWKAVYKSAIETCYKEIDSKKDEILKQLAGPPTNISKDQCNGLFMSMVTCGHLESFVNCPKDSWTDTKQCTDAKAWVNKCGDVDSMFQLQKSRRH